MKTLAFGIAFLSLVAAPALAAPCNTGSVKADAPASTTAGDKSSTADKGSKNLAGGQQPASPGTVGAMNNVGAGQGLGDKGGQANGAEPGSKNLAGGQQPAAPGTVGAMNSTGADQKVGAGDDC
jgi:hypothetical protein